MRSSFEFANAVSVSLCIGWGAGRPAGADVTWSAVGVRSPSIHPSAKIRSAVPSRMEKKRRTQSAVRVLSVLGFPHTGE